MCFYEFQKRRKGPKLVLPLRTALWKFLLLSRLEHSEEIWQVHLSRQSSWAPLTLIHCLQNRRLYPTSISKPLLNLSLQFLACSALSPAAFPGRSFSSVWHFNLYSTHVLIYIDRVTVSKELWHVSRVLGPADLCSVYILFPASRVWIALLLRWANYKLWFIHLRSLYSLGIAFKTHGKFNKLLQLHGK